MKQIFTCVLIFSIALIFSCKDKSTNPPNNYPPGYQHDIPWPSLADSPWPMNHGDPQSTGRSKYSGPKLGTIDWQYPVNNIQTGAIIGYDTTIYFASSGATQGLWALTIDGLLKWNYPLKEGTKEILTTPLQAKDGTIYVPQSMIGKLYAFNTDGTVKWIFQAGSSIVLQGINIGLDGTIYFIDYENTLYAVSNTGSLLWSLTNDEFNGYSSAALSFSPDGKTIYIPGISITVQAFDLQIKTIKWSFGNSRLNAAPLVDASGNIYVNSMVTQLNNGKAALYSLTPYGTVRWSYAHSNINLVKNDTYPTIDKNGNIFICYDTLYSINYDGNLRWKMSINGTSGSPLVNDVEGNVYVSSTNWMDGTFYKIDNNGNVVWEIDFFSPDQYGISPAISSVQRLILPAWRGQNIFSIK